MADLIAGVNERELYAFAIGTNVLSLASTNYVSPYMSFSQLYNDAMKPARNMVTNDYADSGIRIFWTNAEFPADGAVIAESQMEWEVVTNSVNVDGVTMYSYRTTSPTDAVSTIETSNTSKYTPDEQWWPPLKGTNMPFPGMFFGDVKKDVTPFGGDNNWWTHNGLGTNVYKYACERWKNIGSEFLTITKTGGLGFNLSINSLEMPLGYLGANYVSATSTSTDTNLLLASLYEVTGERRNKASFVVSDSGSAVTLNVEFSAHTIAINEGGTYALTIKPTASPGALKICNLSVVGQYITLDRPTMLFTAANWTNAQTLTVSAPDNDVKGDTAAIVLISYDFKSSYVAVSVNDNDGDSDDIRVDPVLGTVFKGEGASFGVSLGTVNTNAVIETSKFITSNNIAQTFNVLDKLNRTVAYLPFSKLEYGTSSYCDYDGSYLDVNETDLDSDSTSTMWGNIASIVSSKVNPNGYGASIFEAVIKSSKASYEDRKTEDDWEDRQQESGSGLTAFIRTKFYEDCFLPYPHKQAIESNYVSKITVYAIAYAVLPSNSDLGRYSRIIAGSTIQENTFTASDYDSTSIDGNACGMLSYLSLHPASTWQETLTQSWNIYDSGVENQKIQKYRVAKLAEVTDPTTVLTFDIGSLSFPSIAYDDVMKSESHRISTLPAGFFYQWREDYDTYANFETEIVVKGFIVMVDWKWKNSRSSAPFEPVENTPDWMTSTSTNTP